MTKIRLRVAAATLTLLALTVAGVSAASPSPAVSPFASPLASPGDETPSPEASTSPSPEPTVKPASFHMPDKVLDLKVKAEDANGVVSQEKGSLASQEIGFYSLRRADNFLQATIEIVRFRPDSGYQSSDFQGGLVDQIGLTRPQTLRVGSVMVHVSASKGLANAIWFRGPFMFVLAIRSEFDRPKSLLRAALDLNP